MHHTLPSSSAVRSLEPARERGRSAEAVPIMNQSPLIDSSTGSSLSHACSVRSHLADSDLGFPLPARYLLFSGHDSGLLTVILLKCFRITRMLLDAPRMVFMNVIITQL